jgi:dCMP deaminase
MINVRWHLKFLDMAKLVASWSKDTARQIGVVIVKDNCAISTGYNGLPRGVDDEPQYRREKPDKQDFAEHAERNAIFQAARMGVSTAGATLYLNYEPQACCAPCARAIVQAGIKTVVGPDRPWSTDPAKSDWAASQKNALDIFKEGGVTLLTVSTTLGVPAIKYGA